MIVEVMDWADFDIPYTKWIGENLEYSGDEEDLIANFLVEEKGLDKIARFIITKTGASGLDQKHLSCVADNFICFLKKEGFKKIQTTKIRFSG